MPSANWEVQKFPVDSKTGIFTESLTCWRLMCCSISTKSQCWKTSGKLSSCSVLINHCRSICILCSSCATVTSVSCSLSNLSSPQTMLRAWHWDKTYHSLLEISTATYPAHTAICMRNCIMHCSETTKTKDKITIKWVERKTIMKDK